MHAELDRLRFELAAAQETNQRSKMRHELMVAATKVGLGEMDVVPHDPGNMDNEFRCSTELRRMLGFKGRTDFPDKLSSRAMCVHPDDAPAVFAAFGYHLNDRTGRALYDVTYRIKLKDDCCRWFVAAGEDGEDRDGTPLLVAWSLRDIHDEKVLLQTSDHQVEQLTASSQRLESVSVN